MSEPIQIDVYKDGKKLGYSAQVANLAAVPGSVFELAQHHGSGNYVAVQAQNGAERPDSLYRTRPEDRLYLLNHEWLEEG